MGKTASGRTGGGLAELETEEPSEEPDTLPFIDRSKYGSSPAGNHMPRGSAPLSSYVQIQEVVLVAGLFMSCSMLVGSSVSLRVLNVGTIL